MNNVKKVDFNFLEDTQKLLKITEGDLSDDLLLLIESFKQNASKEVKVLTKHDDDGITYFIKIISPYYTKSFDLNYDNFEGSTTSCAIYDATDFLKIIFNQLINKEIKQDDEYLTLILQSIMITFFEYAKCNYKNDIVKRYADKLSVEYRKKF